MNEDTEESLIRMLAKHMEEIDTALARWTICAVLRFACSSWWGKALSPRSTCERQLRKQEQDPKSKSASLVLVDKAGHLTSVTRTLRCMLGAIALQAVSGSAFCERPKQVHSD